MTETDTLSNLPLTPEAAEIIRQFRERYPFPLDDFQEQAMRVLASGESVMVAAPTGTGKTIVAEFGIFQAFSQKKRIFYTTPVKALSNQKFKDLHDQYGDAVGLLTGDIIENPNGYIIVMTTEVLRNMLLQTPQEFTHTSCVVFDEIHYLADSERGTTWEESIILCPKTVQLVCLSATITNAAEVCAWISETHRPTRLITHTKRSVPLQLYYFLDGKLNLVIDRDGRKVANFANVGGEAKRKFKRGGGSVDGDERVRERPEPTQREIVDALEKAKMLPAIYFMFSRNDCEVAAELVALNRLELIKEPGRLREIDDVIVKYTNRLDEEDRQMQQVKTIVHLARRGLGFHHAGLLPILKQLVEELFSKGLMSCVFATDTLALGVNMPAKSVVVGRMSKFDGQTRRPLIPNEFQQMAGRAGRRGLDAQGHVIVPYSPWIGFEDTIEIATGALYPVESAFTVRYNSVLNLWDPPEGSRVLQILRNSLMEYQQSRRLRELSAEVHEAQTAYTAARVGCLIGLPDGEELLHEYDSLRHRIEDGRAEEQRLMADELRLRQKMEERPWRKPNRDTLTQVFKTLPPGTILHTEDLGWGIFLGRGVEGGVGLFIFGDRTVRLNDYRSIDYLPPERYNVKLPESLWTLTKPDIVITQVASPEELQELTAQLSQITLPDLAKWLRETRSQNQQKYGATLEKVQQRIEATRQAVKEAKEFERKHPCHSCDVRKKHRKLQNESARLLVAVEDAQNRYNERKTFEENRLQSTLNGIVNVLRKFGFLDKQGYITQKAGFLRDIFDNNGVVIVEMIDRGWLDALEPQDLAEVFSWFAYDREVEFLNRFLLPRHLGELRNKLDDIERDVFAEERRNDLMITSGYNVYFFGAARAWCRGVSLPKILEKMELAEGDIIITFNKTLDLLRQVQDMLETHTPDHPLIYTILQARRLIRRGVVEQIYNIGFGVMQDTLAGEAVTVSPDEIELNGDADLETDDKAVSLDEDEDEDDDEEDEEDLDEVAAPRRFKRRPRRFR
jgi:ATP-dependent RNA helicase HelY